MDMKTKIQMLQEKLQELIKYKKERHITRHKELHKALDELTADLIDHTNKLPSKTTVMELMGWSYEQTKNPTEGDNLGGQDEK